MSTPRSDAILKAWYQGHGWLWCLLPLAWLYRLILTTREMFYRTGLKARYRSSLPVIVVGNITLGGTGKSPLVIHLVEQLRSRGFKPGVVSRGYGAKINKRECRAVRLDSLPSHVGDEPLMLKQRLDCPIFVSPSRRLSLSALEKTDCDIVVADDGLQHYAMDRDIEICVIDGERLLGNEKLLPMGPLREPASRLEHVDACVINGALPSRSFGDRDYKMRLAPGPLSPLNGQSVEYTPARGASVHAVAAIGNPERFFRTLEEIGFQVERHGFEDHHAFCQEDFIFQDDRPIIMTEKDAVKCRNLRLDDVWYLPVNAMLEPSLVDEVLARLHQQGCFNG